ncbi:MAG: DEAD/DEAH box helicase [Oscillospiraceae bacterium]|nr:DEAD/DEAH box helicase [Oscillospiraceae bacterium]
MDNPLSLFSEPTRRWFEKELGLPTPVQAGAWEAISSGENTLVSAPTGTGKTLSAFLVFIDRFIKSRKSGELGDELRVIYISPLKSLAGDIRENLNKPLFGITSETGDALPLVTVAVRTGDTTSSERRKTLKTPPNIFITTPESLYLLLSSVSGQEMLKTAEAIIIDELHALIDTKRGAHLMLSLARLDKLCGKSLQKIGLSATINPLSEAAKYLSPNKPVSIIAPEMKKLIEINVVSPFMGDVPASSSLWQDLANSILRECEGVRSVIAFADGRMYSEKIAYNVNLIAGEGFARTHHGCVSKEQRFEAEDALRKGELRLLCATSSMELGIDVGEIDRVIQVGCPKTVSGVLQRLGRAGHNPGRVSVMRMFPMSAAEGFYCGLTASAALKGGIEPLKPPRLCLDVLAQHLVSMSANDVYDVDDVMELLKNAYPFREITREDVESVLRMLAGDYEHARDIPVRPRLLYDRINNRIEGDAYSRMLAVSSGGTIPDTGMFSCKTESGVKVGELDEEFVFESNVGRKFMLGSFAWKITSIDRETVRVIPTSTSGADSPFWRMAWLGRKYKTARFFGEEMRRLNDIRDYDKICAEMTVLGLDGTAASGAARFLLKQMACTEMLPNDRTIILEHFMDDSGDNLLMVHSVFGRQINNPLALLLREAAKKITRGDVSYFEDDDGVLLMPRSSSAISEGVFNHELLKPDTVYEILEKILPSTPLFNMTFRYNAGRALMMGVRSGKRVPLWVQRLRSAEMLDSVIEYPEHPLIRETKRECLEDYWNLNELVNILKSVRSGEIKILEVFRKDGSPMTRSLRYRAEFDLLYEYFPSTSKIVKSSELEQMQTIKPQSEQLAIVSERRKLPEDEKQLHSLLMAEGDIVMGEYDIDNTWFEVLEKQGRALWVEPGLWIAAEHSGEYENPDWLRIIRRALRYRGCFDACGISERYFIPVDTAREFLDELCESGNAVLDNGMYYHSDLYERAVRMTVTEMRRQVKTMPGECYTALMAGRIAGQSLRDLCGISAPLEAWETIILPARINNYSPALLDNILADGEFYWVIKDNKLTFHLCEDIDYDAELPESDTPVYNTLMSRGAMFVPMLTKAVGLYENKDTIDILYQLMENGLVRADSFVPVRMLNHVKAKNLSIKRQVGSRVSVMTAGRWEVVRPNICLSIEEQINRAFDRAVILCRETANEMSLPWGEALNRLRVWEYTGQARRGYFIEGLSGAQFIRDSDYASTLHALENPSSEIIWLNATDPFLFIQDKDFMRVVGTAVALKKGIPVAVFERGGRILRVYDSDCEKEALSAFVKAFKNGRIYMGLNKITVKEYPKEAAASLKAAGFVDIMLDWELYK